MMKYILAGGTSEVGNRVVKNMVLELGAENIICLVRSTSDCVSVNFLKSLGVQIIVGDVTESEKLFALLNNSHAIYIDMTHPKYYHKSIDVIKKAGIRRAFFVTTTGIYSKYNNASEIYKIGEERIKNSGIEYTILRPSLIYGTDRDRNMTKLLKILAKWPVFPVFGTGQCLMQPIYVQDLADGIATSIFKFEMTGNKEYNLCGPNAISYVRLLELACEALNRKVKLIHIPHRLAVAVAGVGEKIPGFPVKQEQVLRLLEDKSFDITAAQNDLGFTAREFSKGITQEVAFLKEKGIL